MTENKKLLFDLNLWTILRGRLVYMALLNMYSLKSLFQQNKLNVTFKENARLISRTFLE